MREATIAGGLQAQLWIARAPEEAEALVFTRAGREVGRLAVLAALPCSGVVSGKGLTIGGEGVELDRRQRGSLAKQICALYETLAKTLRAGRLPLDQRERALARLVEVDAALTAAGDPLLAELGKPLEQLRAALAGLISPAMRRERAPMRAAEPTARAGLGASPAAAAEISAEGAEISAEGAEISAESAKISPSAAAGAEISPSAAPPRSAASRAAPARPTP